MKHSLKILFVFAFFLSVCTPAWSDRLLLPQNGGAVVLDGDDFSELQRLAWGTRSSSLLDIHPSGSVVASYSHDEGLVFWNTRNLSEASRYRQPLFEGALDMKFSLSGDELYFLSPSLRSVIVFDLKSSEVSRLVPVPGKSPHSISVNSHGILVEQERALSLISTSSESSLVAQFHFAHDLLASVVADGRLFVSLDGEDSLSAFDLPSGRSLEDVPLERAPEKIIASRAGGKLYVLADGGLVQSWGVNGGAPRWSVVLDGVSPDFVCEGRDSGRVYLLDLRAGIIVSVDAERGRELARRRLPQRLSKALALP